MREYINLVESLLTESTGLAGRKPGDEFINDTTGDVLTFQSVTFYPEGGGKFDNQAEMEEMISKIESDNVGMIHWVNEHTPRMLGFGVAKFLGGRHGDTQYLLGRYYQQINHIFTANKFDNTLPGGYHLNKAAANKMRSGLFVQDLLTDLTDLTIIDIISQLETKLGKDHTLVELAQYIAHGGDLPTTIPKGDLDFTSFRDYFCEILQPLALLSGNSANYGAAATEAESIFFKNKGYTKSTVTFGSSKQGGLSDSILTNPDGKEIKLSSKAGVGATASINNLLDAAAEMKASGKHELTAHYAEILAILHDVKEGGQHGGPLKLAQRFDIITANDAKLVTNMRSSGTVELSTRLQKMYDAKLSRSHNQEKSVPYYVMLSSIAEQVANYVNLHTTFNEDAADILNNSALVQIYTNATERDGNITLSKFTSKYPCKLFTKIYFTSDKTYYNTGCKGNFTFTINAPKVDDRPTIEKARDTTISPVANITPRVKSPNVGRDISTPSGGREKR